MHFNLRRSESIISIILISAIIFATWQIFSYKKIVLNQATQYQASAISSNDALQYYLNKKEEKKAKQQEYETQLRQELSKLNALKTIPIQDANNTKDLYDKFVVADLSEMQLHTYKSGVYISSVPILSKGRVGSRWETPAGLYTVSTKEENHFSSIGGVNMPYSMQFFGNFFIHGWPTYRSGEAVPTGYSGGCIRLSTRDAQQIFNFADVGTRLLIVNNATNSSISESIGALSSHVHNVSADAYVVADIDTGAIYAKQNIDKERPMASITKLLTALTSNAVIRYDAKVKIRAGSPITPSDYRGIHKGAMLNANDTVYPLLMESNNAVAHSLAEHYGTSNFLRKMRQQAEALGMSHTTLADASGISPKNTTTARDLFKLARYIYNNSQFILNVTKLKSQTVNSNLGTYSITNHNHFAYNPNFIGGKTGYTTAAKQTMLSIFKVTIDGEQRHIAIVILGSNKRKRDVITLYNWFNKYAQGHQIDNRLFAQDDVTIISGPGANGDLPES